MLPASLQDYMPPGHQSRLIVALVREFGQAFDPRMTGPPLHGYGSGDYLSRRIARRVVERLDFMMIVADTRQTSA